MAYVDIATLMTIATGQPLPAAVVQQIRDNDEFLINPPACSVYNSAVISVANGGGGTLMTADSENYDNDSMHSTSSNTGRITIQTAGRYLFFAVLEFAASATGDRLLRFRVNGGTFYDRVWVKSATTPATIISATQSIVCSAGDYIEVYAQQDSGGPLNCTPKEITALFITR